MKKVLFATSALVASAGFAAADVSFSGKGAAGVASYQGGDVTSYAEAELDITFSGQTDNGLTFGATVDLNSGTDFDVDDGFSSNSGSGSLGTVFISGAMGTLTFDPNGIDDLYDDDDGINHHDISYSYSAGGLSFAVTAEVNGGAPASDVSATLSYSMDGLSFSVTGNDASGTTGGAVVAIGYTVNDMLSLSLSHDMPDVGDDVTEVGANIDFGNGLTVGLSADTADAWDVSVGYTTGAISLAAATDESDEWSASGSYNLGGGASIVAGANHEDTTYLGVAFSF